MQYLVDEESQSGSKNSIMPSDIKLSKMRPISLLVAIFTLKLA